MAEAWALRRADLRLDMVKCERRVEVCSRDRLASF